MTLARSFSAEFPAELGALRRARTRLATALRGLCAADADAFALVLSELFSNVVRHGRPAASCIRVTLTVALDAITLEVADDGGSIPGLDGRIPAARARAPGTWAIHGYGLHIVASEFPLHAYLPKRDAEPLNRFIVRRRNERSDGRAAVLVVEDDAVMAQLLEAYLRSDWTVRGVSNGEQAYAELLLEPADLVVSDIDMSGGGGIELRRRLASRPELAEVAFVFLTGDARPETIETAAALGIDDYVVKPVLGPDLRTVVRRVLTRSRQLAARITARLSEAMTETLRPALPEAVPGWRCAVATRPVEAGGGDLAWSRTAGETTQLVMLDAMGHGPSAKVLASIALGYLYGVMNAADTLDDPAVFMQRLSNVIQADDRIPDLSFACLVANFERDGRVRIANAGQPSPWLVSGTGLRAIDVLGPPIGMPDPEPDPAVSLRLMPRDRLLFATDGIAFDGDDTAAEVARLDGLPGAASAVLFACRDTRVPPDDCTVVLFERHAG